jgi:hypothetical protein
MHNLWVTDGRLSVVMGEKQERHRDPRAYFEHADQMVNNPDALLEEAARLARARDQQLDQEGAEECPDPDFPEINLDGVP